MTHKIALCTWRLAIPFVLFLPALHAEVSVNAVGAQLLVIPLHPSNFSINYPDVHFTASIAGLPDLPSWLHLSKSSSSGTAFLYGVPPPQHSRLLVEVIARSQLTYNTARKLYNISVSPNKRCHFGVSLKITNMDLPDLLSDDLHEDLLQVVVSDLWTDSPQVYHGRDHAVVAGHHKTSAAHHKRSTAHSSAGEWSALQNIWSPLRHHSPETVRSRRAEAAPEDLRRNLLLRPQPDDVIITGLLPASSVGDRVPLEPHIKEGLYVSFGSDSPFSEALLHLQREVSILLNRSPCPHYFKKTSYERFFRARGFAVDWCSFRLHNRTSSRGELWTGVEEPQRRQDGEALTQVAGDLLTRHPDLLPLLSRLQVPHHSYTAAVTETVLVPVMVLLLLVLLLTLALCCAPAHQGETATAFMDDLIDGFPRKATLVELAKGGTSHRRQQMQQQEDSVEHPSLRSRRSQQQACQDVSAGGAPCDADNGYDTAPDVSSDSGSCGSSADSVQLAHSSPRRYEDYATLTRPAPPPYSRAGSASRGDD